MHIEQRRTVHLSACMHADDCAQLTASNCASIAGRCASTSPMSCTCATNSSGLPGCWHKRSLCHHCVTEARHKPGEERERGQATSCMCTSHAWQWLLCIPSMLHMPHKCAPVLLLLHQYYPNNSQCVLLQRRPTAISSVLANPSPVKESVLAAASLQNCRW